MDPLRESAGAPRWTTPDRWHLTLLFLGATPADCVHALVEGAEKAVAAAPAISLRLAGAGRFGSLRRPQVFWAGVDGDVEPLVELAERLAALARALGLPVEDRPFHPHLTLGRWAPRRPADGRLPEQLAGYRGPAWPATEVRLLESHLGRAAHYDTVAAWPVG
jgi:2'-5' RNA ligase